MACSVCVDGGRCGGGAVVALCTSLFLVMMFMFLVVMFLGLGMACGRCLLGSPLLCPPSSRSCLTPFHPCLRASEPCPFRPCWPLFVAIDCRLPFCLSCSPQDCAAKLTRALNEMRVRGVTLNKVGRGCQRWEAGGTRSDKACGVFFPGRFSVDRHTPCVVPAPLRVGGVFSSPALLASLSLFFSGLSLLVSPPLPLEAPVICLFSVLFLPEACMSGTDSRWFLVGHWWACSIVCSVFFLFLSPPFLFAV